MNDVKPPNAEQAPKRGAPAVEGSMSPQAKQRMQKTANLGKKTIKTIIILVFVVALGASAFLWYVFYGPRWGTMHYGICKVFAERFVDFPSSMKIREVEYYGATARVFVSHIDAAGQFNFNVFECEYGQGTLQLTRVRVDRKIISDTDTDNPINPDILRNFNKGLNSILLNPPSLLIPRSKRDAELVDLWQGE